MAAFLRMVYPRLISGKSRLEKVFHCDFTVDNAFMLAVDYAVGGDKCDDQGFLGACSDTEQAHAFPEFGFIAVGNAVLACAEFYFA